MEQEENILMPAVQSVEVAGIKVDYYEGGKGMPLVLLHGWPQTSYIWRKVFPQLQKHYRVIAVDLPGMGNTHALATSDTQTVARWLKDFCAHLELKKIHLAAHDVGAWVAAAFALEYESMLASLVVMDAGIPSLIPEEIFAPQNAKKIWQFYFHAIEGIPEFLIAGKEKEYLSWYFTTKTTVKNAISEKDLEVYIAAYTGKERLSSGFDYYRAFTLSAQQNAALAHQLTVPILAIGAAQGQGLNMGKAMQKIALNEVKVISIDDCGHYIAEEQPGALLEALLPFLQEIAEPS